MKAQSMIEYLMEYGWMILIAIIVIAVLWSLGIFDSETFRQQPYWVEDWECVEWDTEYQFVRKTLRTENVTFKIGPGEMCLIEYCRISKGYLPGIVIGFEYQEFDDIVVAELEYGFVIENNNSSNVIEFNGTVYSTSDIMKQVSTNCTKQQLVRELVE